MTSFTLSLEQLRRAPRDVRRWLRNEILQAAARGESGEDTSVLFRQLTALNLAAEDNPAEIDTVTSFGPFRLFHRQRLLLQDGSPLSLRSEIPHWGWTR